VLVRLSWLGWWTAAGAFAVLGLLGVLTHPSPTPASVELAASAPAAPGIDVLDVFDAEVLAQVAAYRTPRRALALWLHAISIAVPLLMLALVIRPRSARPRAVPRWWIELLDDEHPAPQPLRIAALAASVVVLVGSVQLPLVAWLRVVHDARFGMRTQSALSWFGDHLLLVSTRVALIAVAAAGVSWLIHRSPRQWPAQLTLVAGSVALVLVTLAPLVIHPFTLPERELPEGVHRDAVLAVVARSGLDIPVMLGEASVRTTRRNAVVTGLGPTRRIVLHDTLLDLDPADVAALTAHELAHLEHRDLLRGALAVAPVTLMGSLGGAALLRRGRRRADLRADLRAGPPIGARADEWSGGGDGAAPGAGGAGAAGSSMHPTRTLVGILALVLIAEVVASPLVAAQSRRIERAADARVIMLAGEVEPWIVTLRAFTVDDLADPQPPAWAAALSSHPSSARRIRAALSIAEQIGVPVDVGRVLSAEAARSARR
jgi:STE24 endopeptidase